MMKSFIEEQILGFIVSATYYKWSQMYIVKKEQQTKTNHQHNKIVFFKIEYFQYSIKERKLHFLRKLLT